MILGIISTAALCALLVAAAYIVTRIAIATAQWLKGKIKERLIQKETDTVLVMTGEAIKAAVKQAHKGSTNELDALDSIPNDDLFLTNVTTDGDIEKLERVRVEQGTQQGLRSYLNENDGMVLFES